MVYRTGHASQFEDTAVGRMCGLLILVCEQIEVLDGLWNTK